MNFKQDSKVTLPKEVFEEMIKELAIEDGIMKEFQDVRLTDAEWDGKYDLVTFKFTITGRLDS